MAEQTLVTRLTTLASRIPDHVAFIDGGRRVTLRALVDAAAAFAGALQARGVKPGDVVTWQLPNRWEAAVVHHGILRAGAVPNPVDPTLSETDLLPILTEAEPVLVLTPSTWRGIDFGARTLPVPTEVVTEDLLLTSAPTEPVPREPDDLALLLYTSGTTAMPKGVLHSHRSLLAEVDSFEQIHALTADDRCLGGAPVTHIAGLVYGLLAPAALGTSTTLLARWNPTEALTLIERDRATFMTGPPTFLHTLAEAHTTQDVSSFRLFSTGGASISTEQIRAAATRLRCMVKRAYGSTEMPTLTATTCDDDEDARLQTDGRAIGDATMRIVRADGSDASVNDDGEIWARGPELFVGYRSGARSLTPDGWFRTGDIGRVDERGLLRVTGRLKDIIIRGGENISAAEVEDALLSLPEVDDAAVIGIPDERLGERVAAVVVSRARLTLDDLTTSLRARNLSTHKLPEFLRIVDALPRTASGKVRKAELREAFGR